MAKRNIIRVFEGFAGYGGAMYGGISSFCGSLGFSSSVSPTGFLIALGRLNFEISTTLGITTSVATVEPKSEVSSG